MPTTAARYFLETTLRVASLYSHSSADLPSQYQHGRPRTPPASPFFDIAGAFTFRCAIDRKCFYLPLHSQHKPTSPQYWRAHLSPMAIFGRLLHTFHMRRGSCRRLYYQRAMRASPGRRRGLSPGARDIIIIRRHAAAAIEHGPAEKCRIS